MVGIPDYFKACCREMFDKMSSQKHEKKAPENDSNAKSEIKPGDTL
jgi:hypothetical protein